MASSRQGGPAGDISVVIPTRNRSDLLRQTLTSVAAQSLPVAEIIVADDGSSESLDSLLLEWGATWVRNAQGGWGAAAARNAGLERVATEFVAFVDSDDLLLPRSLELLRSALEHAPEAPFAYGRSLVAIRERSGWRPDSLIAVDADECTDLLRSIYIRNSVPSSGALVRTEAARAVGGYNSRMRFIEDHEFWIRLAQEGEPVHVPEIVALYRRHSGNRHTPALASSEAENVVRIAESDPRLRPVLPERIGVELCEVSISAVKCRQPQLAWKTARQLLAGRGGKGVVLRRSWQHWRRRRVWRREALELWRYRTDLRDWLASY